MAITNTRWTAPSCGLINTAPARSKKAEDQALGRSRGGLSTKIHALVDALGNPLRFLLPGQDDLAGADALLPHMTANRLIADRAFDADCRVLDPLAAAGKSAAISWSISRPTKGLGSGSDTPAHALMASVRRFGCYSASS